MNKTKLDLIFFASEKKYKTNLLFATICSGSLVAHIR